MKQSSGMLLFVLMILFAVNAAANEIDSLKSLLPSASQSEQITIYNSLGKLYYRKGKYADALENFNHTLTLANETNDSLQMAKSLSNIGVINDLLGNYAVAMEHYQQSLSIYDKLENSQGKESVLNNIGIVYEEMKEPEKALNYYFKALDLKKQRGDSNSVARTYNNIAIIYGYFHEDSDSAYYFYQKALGIYKKNGTENDEAPIYSNLGLIHLRKGETDQARDDFRKALAVFEKSGETKNIATVLHYMGLLNHQEEKYSKALEYYNQALKLANASGLKKLQSQLYNDLSKIHEENHNFKKALEYNKRYESIKDSILNLEKIRQIHKLEINFEIEKREHEIELLKKQGELNELKLTWNKTLTYALVAIFTLTVIVIILYFARKRYKKQQELLMLQTRLFRSQTSPHFIFNSLMSIQTFLLSNKVEKASDYLVDFAKLIRSILQYTRENFVSLEKEIELITQYVKLEKLRFSDKFDYSIEVDVEDPSEIQIPPMLAQPFIENAIIHGLVPSQTKGLLSISITEKGNFLIIEIKDNGVGRSKQKTGSKGSDHKSMATDITSQRIRLLNNRFGKNISMVTEDLTNENGQPSGTCVRFTLDI